MKRFGILTKLEIKRSIKAVPKLIAGALLMLLVVIAIGIGAGSILGNNDENEDGTQKNRINVGVVCYDESKWMSLAKSMIDSIESISDNIHLMFMEEDEAKEKLEDNELMAVITIPDNVIKDIISGKNTPIEVEFVENAGYEAAVFKEIADAAVNMLASSQAGVYSVYDFYNENNRDAYIDSALDRLNGRYIGQVLTRAEMFKNTEVLATGDLDIMEYYLISGIVLFLFLLGINSITFGESHKKEITALLSNGGVSVRGQVLARFLGFESVYMIIRTVVIIPFGIVSGMETVRIIVLWFAMIPVTMAVSAIMLLIQIWFKNKSAAVMFIFFVAVIQGFVTGSFIPQVMLPDVLSKVSHIMPGHYMINQIKYVYQGEEAGIVLLNSAVLLLITIFAMELSSLRAGYERKAGR